MNKLKGLLVIVLLTVVFLLSFYGKILSSPNSFLFTANGDGLKNYYTYAYHVKHDSSYHHFEGMNYPYGELVAYTDGHYALSNAVKFLDSKFEGVYNYSIGILNFILVSSFLLSAIFIYLILVKYEVHPLISAIAALSILILAPQIERLEGHLSLSYSFFIPLTWLLLLNIKEGKKLAYLLLFVSQVIFLFTHPYLGVISAFFTVLWAVFNYFKNWRQLLFLIGVSVAALVFFQIVVISLDTHIERPGTPSGFFHYCAQIGSVFQPHAEPFYSFYYENFGKPKQRWEGWAYIGLPAVILCLYLIFSGVYNRGRFKYWTQLPKSYVYLLFIGVLGLFYSYGFPYRQGFEFVLDLFPFIRQIRVLGRFAWIFYFVITVFCFVYISWKVKNTKLKYSLLTVVAVFNFWEGFAYHKNKEERLTRAENLFKSKTEQQDLSEYQAILPLPYYYIGNENIVIPKKHDVFMESLMLSYHNGLPLMSNCLSRSSNSDSRNILSLFSPINRSKSLDSLLSDDKILILKSNDHLNKFEAAVLNKADSLFQLGEFTYYEISKKALVEKNFVCTDLMENDEDLLFFNSFNSSKESFDLDGGVYSGMKKSNNIYFKGSIDNRDTINVSFWYWVGEDNLSENLMIIEEKDSISGKVEWTHTQGMSYSFITKGDWQYVEIEFVPKEWSNQITVLSRAYTRKDQKFYLDRLMIRRLGRDVVQKNKSGTWINNLPYHQ